MLAHPTHPPSPFLSLRPWALVHFHNLCTPRDSGAEITAGSWRWVPFSVRFINFNWKLRHNKWRGGRGTETVWEWQGERLKYSQKYEQLNAKNMRNTHDIWQTSNPSPSLRQLETHRTEAAWTHLEPIDKPEICHKNSAVGQLAWHKKRSSSAEISSLSSWTLQMFG